MTPRTKAIIFLTLWVALFIWMFPGGYQFEVWKKMPFSSNLGSLLLIIVVTVPIAFILLGIIDAIFNFFNKSSTKTNSSNDGSKLIGEKDRLRINYWADILEGKARLENGEKYDQNTFYNKKFLKYPLKEIKSAIIKQAVLMGIKDKKIFNACNTSYMYLANFGTNIQDMKPTGIADMNKIIEKYPQEIIEKDNKQFKKLTKEIASMGKEDKTYSETKLIQLQTKFAAEFTATFKYVINSAQKKLKNKNK